MARAKRKTETKVTAGNGSAEGLGHNSKHELTDDQRQALFFSHKRGYKTALAKKKEADAQFKNACKRAKAELGDDAVASIKDALLLDSPEGEARLRTSIERQMRVARWMNVPFGQQAELFTDFTDPTPAVDRARAEGKKAGMEAKDRKPPYDPSVPQHDQWIEGWHEGQKAVFNIQRLADADKFDRAETEADGAAASV